MFFKSLLIFSTKPLSLLIFSSTKFILPISELFSFIQTSKYPRRVFLYKSILFSFKLIKRIGIKLSLHIANDCAANIPNSANFVPYTLKQLLDKL